MSVILTSHGKNRIIKRTEGKKKTAVKLAEKAFNEGIRHKEAKGRLKKYLDKLYLCHKTANNIRVYNQKVFLFQGEKLITVFSLPANLCKTADQISKKRSGGDTLN